MKNKVLELELNSSRCYTPLLGLLAALMAIRWLDAAVLATDMLRAAVLMVLSTLGQHPQHFTGVQINNRAYSMMPSELSFRCQASS